MIELKHEKQTSRFTGFQNCALYMRDNLVFYPILGDLSSKETRE
jgi:hypothetical protein